MYGAASETIECACDTDGCNSAPSMFHSSPLGVAAAAAVVAVVNSSGLLSKLGIL